MKFNTQTLVKVAALTAMSVALNIFTITVIPFTSNVLSFIFIPAFIAGIFYGPLAGGLVGCIGDVLGFIIAPSGYPYLVLITLSSTLIGLIPGLIFRYLKKGDPLLKITLSFILCWLICTVTINTFANWYWIMPLIVTDPVKRKTFIPYLVARIPIQTLNIVVNYIIVLALHESEVLKKVFLIKQRA